MTYRVLHILPDFGVGGAERMAVHLMQHTSSAFQVRAVSLFSPRRTVLESELASVGISVAFLGKHLGPDVSMVPKIDRILRDYRPHVVHTHRYALKYVLPSMLVRRVPAMVHTVHSIAEREVGRADRLIHGFGFRHGVVPVSIADQVTDSIVRVYGPQPLMTCIPNGIPVSEYRISATPRDVWRDAEGLPRDAFVYVCVARLSPPKNHRMLLEAFAHGPGRRTLTYLVLAGDGDERAALEEYAVQLGIQGRVRFLGQRTDIVSILNASDVFVLSSLWEGNPLSVMEAMASGKSVVCTAVGGIPELIQDGVDGTLVPSEGVKNLERAMTRLLDDGDFRTSLGAKALVKSKKFDARTMAGKYEALYLHLLNK